MTAAVTIPCRQDPDAWDLPGGGITKLEIRDLRQAVDAAKGCDRCPFKGRECAAWKPANYEDRTVQNGEIFEPGVGWMDLAVWLFRAGARTCKWCGDLTRNDNYCNQFCSAAGRIGRAHGPRPQTRKTAKTERGALVSKLGHQGLTAPEIARELGVSVRTVNNYRARARQAVA